MTGDKLKLTQNVLLIINLVKFILLTHTVYQEITGFKALSLNFNNIEVIKVRICGKANTGCSGFAMNILDSPRITKPSFNSR